jgi:YidC/Oxa1 family membrane protein insertase
MPGAKAPNGPAPAVAAAKTDSETRAQALADSVRIPIRTPSLSGSIALTGARIDDLTLIKYHRTVDPHSPNITLLSPPGSPQPYYAEFGWVAGSGVKTPGPDTIWHPTNPNAVLTVDHPVALTWDNGAGLRFVRTYGVDKDYMFTVTERVENYGSKPVKLYPYGSVSRGGEPPESHTYILHEGPLGELDGSVHEKSYEDLRKDARWSKESTGGWIGFTDKYWLTAVVPGNDAKVTGRFTYRHTAAGNHYQADFTAAKATDVAPGANAQVGYHFFAGAKIVGLLDGYAAKLHIPKFSFAIDFGWFWFLTKPFFYLLQMLHEALGNMGLAIIAMTVIIKLAMFPLANKSYAAMSRMKRLQPEIKRMQERFADDKARMQQEMMALYKREKVNPAGGCLPMVVQVPVFFALYKVLFVTIEMRHAPFYGWIHDLSAPDPTNIFTLFGLIPWDPTHYLSFLHIGIWPLIMGVTMWLQQKLNPQMADPMQAKMFQFLPIVFTFLLGRFAAGLVIYWALSNTLSVLQQWVIMRRVTPAPKTV